MAEEAANAVPHPAPEGLRRVCVVVDDKGDSGSLFDPVTAVGRNLEEAIRDVPVRQRPNDAVIGEEFGKTAGDSGPPWVIDPIDGTRPFLAGPPLWPSMSAPATAPARSSACSTSRIRMSDAGGSRSTASPPSAPPGKASASTFAPDPAQSWRTRGSAPTPLKPSRPRPNGRPALDSQDGRFARHGCGACMFAMLADAGADLIPEIGLHAYDSMALAPAVNGAGGCLAHWSDGPPAGAAAPRQPAMRPCRPQFSAGLRAPGQPRQPTVRHLHRPCNVGRVGLTISLAARDTANRPPA